MIDNGLKGVLSMVIAIFGMLLLFIIIFAVFYYFKYLRKYIEYDLDENLDVSSDAFGNGDTLPVRHTGRGEDISPSLKLGTVKADAKSIAVIMDDPDTPIGTFTHWVVWNIPANVSFIPEGIQKEKTISSLGNACHGKNGYLTTGYRGPKPPRGIGVHTYRFKVYVLDTELKLKSSTGKNRLLIAMKGHVIQYGVLTGRFGSW